MNEAFICDFARTPVGRYGGALARVRADDLAVLPMRALLERHANLSEQIEQVIFGCANQAGEDNRNVARMAALLVGLPEHVPGITLNRLCASSMDAVAMAARQIMTGEIGLAIAGGAESMSRAPLVMPKAESAFSRQAELYDTTIGWRFVNPLMQERFGTDSLPGTAENVADEYHVSRADQDAFAHRSQQRTEDAKQAGRLGAPIVPVEIVVGKKGETNTVTEDEHPRPDTTPEVLAKLKPIIKKDGTITAGNASGVNDGAAAFLVASKQAAEAHGLTPRARILGVASAGVPPRVMGMGPVPSTRKLVERLNMKVSDFDVIELNEAFAAQSLACLRELGIPDDAEHVNPNGGAIALGHPLGMSGARIVGAAVDELVRRDGKYALATMCVGVGQGVSMALEKV